MKAMILAAGLGTRLGSLTKNTPKCLLEAGGKTILEHIFEKLIKAGVTEVVINLHFQSSKIENFILNNNSFGIKVTFSHESSLLGTGGGLKQAKKILQSEDAFFLYNADIICDFNLRELLEKHYSNNALATLATMDRDTKRYLLFNRQMKLVGWKNYSTGQSKELVSGPFIERAFCGIHVISGKIFDYLDSHQEKEFSIITTYLNASLENEDIISCDITEDSYWIDMGTPEKLARLRKKLSEEEAA